MGALSCNEQTGGAALSAMFVADMIEGDCDVAVLTGSNETSRLNVHELRLGPVRAAAPMLLRLPMGLVGLTRQVERIVDKVRPDLIHLQDAHLMDPVLPVALRLGLPVIVTLRDLLFVPSFQSNQVDGKGGIRPGPWARGRAFLGLCQWRRPVSWTLPLLLPWLYAKPARMLALMKQATILLPVSNYMKEEISRCGIKTPCEVLMLDPVPDWPMRPLPNARKIRFLYTGRLVEGKGIDVLLKSFSRVLSELPDAELMIAGDGPKRPQLERLAGRLGCAQRTRFLGQVAYAEIHLLYEEADIVVFPSTIPEGSGRVALEAAMVGRPVIAARSGGLTEIIGTECGILVSPGDVQELAQQMVALACDRERQARIVQAARTQVFQFTAANLRIRLLEMYRRVLAGKGATISNSRD
jgi:glycosyltransferase involved in cell wall biosynthesis